ncbi:hypothetical protein GCM10009429_23530 [Dyella marensis]
MSRFYVGQRVVLARPRNPNNKGLTGTIVRFSEFPKGTMMRDGACSINCDCVVDYDARGMCADHTERLDPLTDSYDVVSWKDCAWKPEHLRVGV